MIKEVPMSRNDVFIDLGSGKSYLEFLCMVTLWLWRQSGPVVNALDSESNGLEFKLWPGSLYCFLGQGTSHPQCLSSPRCINGYQRI